MRRIGWLLMAVLLLAGGCRKRPAQVDTIEDENLPALSVVPMAHPRAAPQLLAGFHAVEQGSWRWTMGRFAVALKPPPGAEKTGARLEMHLAVPEIVLSHVQSVTLTAAVEGTALAPETYTKAGEYTYSRPVPASALRISPAKVTFALDKYLKSGAIEARELGVIVSSVGLARQL
jgi:hypothetical protein